ELADHQGSDEREQDGHADHHGHQRGDPAARRAHAPGLSCLRAPRTIHEGAELCRATRLLGLVLFAHASNLAEVCRSGGANRTSQPLPAGVAPGGREPTRPNPAPPPKRESTTTPFVPTTNGSAPMTSPPPSQIPPSAPPP